VPPLLAVKADLPYLTTVLLVDVQVDTYKVTGWEKLVKPWFDVWLPDETVEPYVTETIRSLTLQDYSPTGFVLLIPHRRPAFSRPFFRVPDSPNGWVWLFDILNDSRLALSTGAFTSTMLARNRRLFDRSRQFGGVRYPIGAIDFSQTDWISHYGPVWNDFVQRKQLYDPANILTPGLGIFFSS
jgi:cytokinin dehydrogenase